MEGPFERSSFLSYLCALRGRSCGALAVHIWNISELLVDMVDVREWNTADAISCGEKYGRKVVLYVVNTIVCVPS